MSKKHERRVDIQRQRMPLGMQAVRGYSGRHMHKAERKHMHHQSIHTRINKKISLWQTRYLRRRIGGSVVRNKWGYAYRRI